MRLEPSDLEAIAALIQETVNPQFKKMDDRLDALFEHMQDRFDETNTRIGAVEHKVDLIADTLDSYAKQMETSEQERLVQSKQLDGLEQRVTALESAA